jgi:hypothetical protein
MHLVIWNLSFQIWGLGVGGKWGEGNSASKVSANTVRDEGIVGGNHTVESKRGNHTVENKRLMSVHLYRSGVGVVLLILNIMAVGFS